MENTKSRTDVELTACERGEIWYLQVLAARFMELGPFRRALRRPMVDWLCKDKENFWLSMAKALPGRRSAYECFNQAVCLRSRLCGRECIGTSSFSRSESFNLLFQSAGISNVAPFGEAQSWADMAAALSTSPLCPPSFGSMDLVMEIFQLQDFIDAYLVSTVNQ